MVEYIYYVGKPYPYIESLETVKKLGYKIGLLLDKTVKLKNPDAYDRVVQIDFTSSDNLVPQIAELDLQAAGLVATYENYIVAQSILGEHLGVAVNSLEAAKACTDKYLMRQSFLKADQTITPKFGTATTEDEVLKLASELGYPVILKPTNLVKSLLVLKCQNQNELIENFDYAKKTIKKLYEKYKIYDREPQLLVEQYLTGKICSIAAFVDSSGQSHFCDGITALQSARDQGVDDNYLFSRTLPAELPENLKTKLFLTAEKGIKALNMKSTPAHVELIYDGLDVKLIEIGARIGGYRPRMYKESYGLDLIEQEVLLALGQQPKLEGSFKNYTSVYEVFPSTTGTFKSLSGVVSEDNFSYFSVKKKPGQEVGPAKFGFKACAVIIAITKNKEQLKSLAKMVENIQVELQ